MATPHVRRATTPFGQARRTPAARPIYSDSESSEDDLWRAPASVLLVDGTPGRGAMRAARQAETMEELEIDPPPARVSSSSGRAGPSPRSTPGYDPGSDDGMEYEDSDLEREADEYRAMLVGASGGERRVFRDSGAFATPKPRGNEQTDAHRTTPASSSSRRGWVRGAGSAFGASSGPVRGSLHRPSSFTSTHASRTVDFESTTTTPLMPGEGVRVDDGAHDDGRVAVLHTVSTYKEEFEAIRRELAEIKSNMSSPANASASAPNSNLDGATPGGWTGEYPHGPRRASVDRGSFGGGGGGGGSVARNVHGGGGGVVRQQQRRDSNGSTDGGGGRPRWGGSGAHRSDRSAGSSKTSARHRSGRTVSSELTTGTGRLLFGDYDTEGRLLFGDDDGGRSAGGGDPAGPTARVNNGVTATTVDDDDAGDGGRRRRGDAVVTETRRRSADDAPGWNESSRSSRGGGGLPGSNESPRSREGTRARATRETAVNTDRSEAEEGGGARGRRGESPSRKSSPSRRSASFLSVVVSALRLFALMLLLAGTWYMVLVIVDVIEEDFLSGRLPRSNLFLDSLTRTPLEWIRRVGGYDGLDDDPPFAAPT